MAALSLSRRHDEIIGRQVMARRPPGWRFHRDGLEVTVFAGTDVQDHRSAPADPGNRLAVPLSACAAASTSGTSHSRDAMLTASASLSTVGTSYWTRAAAGGALRCVGRTGIPRCAATTVTASSASACMPRACACGATSGPPAPGGDGTATGRSGIYGRLTRRYIVMCPARPCA